MTESKLKSVIREVTSNLPNWKADGLRARWTEKPELFVGFSVESVNKLLDNLPGSAKNYIRKALESAETGFRKYS